MPHVTFIHGIANKPSKENLIKHWELALKRGGLNLGAKGVTTSMVYWADIMYAQPSSSDTAYESIENHYDFMDEEDLSWTNNLTAPEQEFIENFKNKFDFAKLESKSDEENDEPPTEEEKDIFVEGKIDLEAVPLPWFIKKRIMRRFLRDVHHYLFNQTHSPRPGENYKVQDHIRNLFVSQLAYDNANADGKHIVVSHSMGTVIAYDCLKHLSTCPAIDGLMTVGSPLGLSEVQDNFSPKLDKSNGFLTDKLNDQKWINVYDRLDPVALDAKLANDYKKNGEKVIDDIKVKNSGWWRHSGEKYLAQPELCKKLKTLLDL